MNDTTHYFDIHDGDPIGQTCRRMVIEDGDGVECGLPRWHPVHRVFASPPSESPDRAELLAAHQFAPKYPVVCSCGFSAGFAMDSETPWLHHVAFLLREAGLTPPDEHTADLNIVRQGET